VVTHAIVLQSIDNHTQQDFIIEGFARLLFISSNILSNNSNSDSMSELKRVDKINVKLPTNREATLG
jgi:hypothetical protein